MSTQWEKGVSLPDRVRGPVTRMDLIRYAGASGDFNPIHTVEEFAQEVGLDGVIGHGMLTMAYVGRLLTDFAGDEADLTEFGVRFRAMVRPGDTIHCKATVTDVSEQDNRLVAKVQVVAENQRGETIVKGTAVLVRERG